MTGRDKIFSAMRAVASAMEQEKQSADIPAATLTEYEVKFIKELIKKMNGEKDD